MTTRRRRVRDCAWMTFVTILAVGACSRPPAKDAATAAVPASAPDRSSLERSGYDGELPPLPQVQFASARPAPITRAAYEFAARHPEVLRYMPCFCGCEKHGHGNNEDCFIATREADGRPVWSPHGIGCGICIDVAREAARLHKAGVPLPDVRAAIDRKYSTEYPIGTPTPKPPRAGHD
jgi:Protein of unknown function with PCYCGC motif